MAKLRVVNVSKSFGRIKALENVSFEVKEGEYIGVIGPSGCGKTTLLKIIAGIVKQDSGDIYIDERLVNDLLPEERGIGYIFQDILLFPHMTIWDNIAYSPMIRGLDDKQTTRIVRELMSHLGISVRYKSYPQELSRGMQQKTAIARALARESELLLLDEPLSSLDTRVRISLRYELRKIVKELGLTAIHVTHDQDEAMSICDRIILMRKGRIEQIDAPLNLYLKPKSLFVAKFIGGECNFLEGVIEEENGRKLIRSGSIVLYCSKHEFKKGQRVVAAIKPEHFRLVSSEFKGPNVIQGKVTDINYLGVFIRLLLKTDQTELTVKLPKSALNSIRVNSQIRLYIPEDMINIYEYPKEGLEEATAIEQSV